MKENKNEVMVFNNEMFGSVRVVRIDNKEYFVGIDIAKALDYSNASKAVSTHCDYTIKKMLTHQSNTGVVKTQTTLIDDLGVNSLIQKATTKSEEYKHDFKCWLVSTGLIENKIIHKTRKEIEFIDKLERALLAFNVTGKKQHNVLNYRIDYYIPSLNVAIEYDENGHKDYTYEAHELRQELIQKELGCRFIRVTDNKDDYVNIGLVIKEILNIK